MSTAREFLIIVWGDDFGFTTSATALTRAQASFTTPTTPVQGQQKQSQSQRLRGLPETKDKGMYFVFSLSYELESIVLTGRSAMQSDLDARLVKTTDESVDTQRSLTNRDRQP
jgi:hypothetical protein